MLKITAPTGIQIPSGLFRWCKSGLSNFQLTFAISGCQLAFKHRYTPH
ncbi:MAG: hypothetical protein IPM82_05220 [Saprospiraceae bacterium]|nr:hypothetical protein [Saprospiraceae bacterium]